MTRQNEEWAIVPVDYPELKLLAWNRDVTQPISARDAFALDERNWRHVRLEAMTEHERDLVKDLAATFGNGFILS